MDPAKCEACWAGFVHSLALGDSRRAAVPDAFGFGGEGQLADELAALVLAGKKKATASLPVEYTSIQAPLPKAGDLSIILDGDGHPVGIIERTSVDLVPFSEVGAEFAAQEGEGDGSLRYWREAHTWYFGRVCDQLGGKLEDSTPILCQRFKLVWPLLAQRTLTEAPMRRTIVETPGAPTPVGPYSQGVILDGWLWTSGQVALDPATGKVVGRDAAAQADRTLQNIRAILEAGGSGLEHVVRATVYLTNMDDFAAVNAVYARYFPSAFPARVCVEVSRLPLGALVEIDVTARIAA